MYRLPLNENAPVFTDIHAHSGPVRALACGSLQPGQAARGGPYFLGSVGADGCMCVALEVREHARAGPLGRELTGVVTRGVANRQKS